VGPAGPFGDANRRGRVSLRDRAPIRRFAELSDNIVHWSEFDRGGHFAAMEEPDLLVADVRQFFSQLR
jgi:pimeloyl-ACP methyl ester carboxylesterase